MSGISCVYTGDIAALIYTEHYVPAACSNGHFYIMTPFAYSSSRRRNRKAWNTTLVNWSDTYVVLILVTFE